MVKLVVLLAISALLAAADLTDDAFRETLRLLESSTPPLSTSRSPLFPNSVLNPLDAYAPLVLLEPLEGHELRNTSKGLRWTNWSGTVATAIDEFIEPTTFDEVVEAVRKCVEAKAAMRAVGAGHSDAPLVSFGWSERRRRVLLSLDKMPKGISSVDKTKEVVEVWAGTRQSELGPLLWEAGWTYLSVSNFNGQTVGGAISTSTHGRNRNVGTISSLVVGMTLVDGNGEVVVVEEDDPDLGGYRQALGLLGVIVKVKLKVVPRRLLLREVYTLTFTESMTTFEATMKSAEYVDIRVNHDVRSAVVTKLNESEGPEISKEKKKEVMERLKATNIITRAAFELGRQSPQLAFTSNDVWSRLLGRPSTTINAAHEVMGGSSPFKHNQIECFVPLQEAVAAFEEIAAFMHTLPFCPLGSTLLRLMKADDSDVWLSPASSVPSPLLKKKGFNETVTHIVAFGLIEYADTFVPRFKDTVEQICMEHGSRPHSGKLHNHIAEDWETLEAYYPRVGDFLRLRQRRDPKGFFLNEWLRRDLLVDEFEKRERRA